MKDINNILQSALSDKIIDQFSKNLDGNSEKTKSVVQQVISTLMAALAQNTRSDKEAQSLKKALENDHDGSILDDVSGYLFGDRSGGRMTNSEGILTHILGDKRTKVQAQLSKQTGLGEDKINDLMKKLAPVVLGAMGKAKQDSGFKTDKLSQQLMEQAKQQSPSPDALKALAGFLDKDGDGSFTDEATEFLGGFFKKGK